MMLHRLPPEVEVGVLPQDVGIPVGQHAPKATVVDPEGHEVQILDLTRKGSILLVFYRGGWCPFCNFQIHELTAAFPEFEKRGLTPVAISVDRIEEAAKTQATYTIPFPVLSDPDLVAHSAYRVIHRVEADELARLRGFGMDLERASGRTHHEIAIPALFVIDAGGVVRWAHADRDYKVRPSPSQILAAFDRLQLHAH